jgi:hypothetical protein
MDISDEGVRMKTHKGIIYTNIEKLNTVEFKSNQHPSMIVTHLMKLSLCHSTLEVMISMVKIELYILMSYGAVCLVTANFAQFYNSLNFNQIPYSSGRITQ